ncbi:hypothetical protein [Butyrivibrio sp. YAB3001]|uniref:hypothetical protein n=1 Tax=Butyrivibrio sp. YAB3001 TaxID=1520812 RepID=UPI0008F6412C|nr:hypothetical protein [Butyrivibrio sp. YAB3001]SFC83467.1 hypothetical protein SAMN02910398_03255 [Butyrivibrio sp. YAB3001]
MKDSECMSGDKGTSLLLKKIKKIRRKIMSLQTIRKIKEVSLSASMTLEASIILPLFIFFFINIIAVIDIIYVQSELEACLHQVGNETAMLAFDMRTGEEVLQLDEDSRAKNITEMGTLGLHAVSEIRERLEDKLSGSAVMDGVKSLKFSSSRIMYENDIIDIVVDYKVHPIIRLAGFKEFPVEARFYGHAWTGYDISGGTDINHNEEEVVFITEHGTVYHRDSGCKYLNHKIESIRYEDIENKRNLDGAKYYSCEYCGKGIAGGNVFITNYGKKYHTRLNCPGLKRNIYAIPISEVGGRSPCHGCG